MKRKTLNAIRAHYAHAKAKHPKFCDRLDVRYRSLRDAEGDLSEFRKLLCTYIEICDVPATVLLQCEIAEMVVELAKGDNARAREEALDCIAVLIRIIDELEARP